MIKAPTDVKINKMRAILLIKSISQRFSRDDMTTHAGSVSFWLIISSVPFLMLIIGLASHIPGLGREDVTDMLYSALPDMVNLHELVDSVLSNIYIDSPGTVISLSAILTLWSASSGVYRLERAIRSACGSSGPEGYVVSRLQSLLYTLIFLLAIILSLLLLVLGSALGSILMDHFPVISGAVMMFLDFKLLVTAAILFLFMVFLYRFIPGRTDERLPILPGALFATLSWILASYAFSIYFTYFKNISYMYGSLGAVVLLMFWLFAIICIILAGAEINAVFDLLELTSIKRFRAFLKGEPPYSE